MRRTWTLALLLAVILATTGTGSANAFGSEVLGCSVDTAAWTTPQCAGGGGDDSQATMVIHYAAHSLSGTYSYNWTITEWFVGVGTPVTAACSSTAAYKCIVSGCTTTSSTCDVRVKQPIRDRRYEAAVLLTQSGQSRTISANALIDGVPLY